MRNRILVITLVCVVVASFVPVSKQVEIKVTVKHTKPTPPPTKASWEEKKVNKILARQYASAGWGWNANQQRCAYKLFMLESKFDNYARNQKGSTAYGIAQMLNEKSSDPTIQILHAYRYINVRYGTPCRAYWFHLRHSWY